jgi:predicted nucleic acid-binding protein
MKILFDTNVILDVLLDRQPFSEDATSLMSAVELGILQGYICATTLTTIHYIASKTIGEQAARQALSQLLKLFEVAPVTRVILSNALDSSFTDFEDAVLDQSALHVGALGIVTRNFKDFQGTMLAVYSPAALLASINSIK